MTNLRYSIFDVTTKICGTWRSLSLFIDIAEIEFSRATSIDIRLSTRAIFFKTRKRQLRHVCVV